LEEQTNILRRQCDEQFMNYKEEEYKYNELNGNYKILQNKYIKTTQIIQENNSIDDYDFIKNSNITKNELVNMIITKCNNGSSVINELKI
jgi:hypothetical protein